MELKFARLAEEYEKLKSSNRTFMELKYSFHVCLLVCLFMF